LDRLLVTSLHMAADSIVESLNSWIQRTLFSRNQQQQRVDWSGPCDRLLWQTHKSRWKRLLCLRKMDMVSLTVKRSMDLESTYPLHL
jgi:hypothetical protein